jgi:hypothetical protein
MKANSYKDEDSQIVSLLWLVYLSF